MPIYEYQCGACGHQLEKLQKMSEAPLTHCPSCSESELKKMMSASAFRLKGGGWYETDFKTGSKKNLEGDKSNTSQSSEKASADSSGKPSADSSAHSSGEAANKPKATGKEPAKAASKPAGKVD